ncbi:3'-5' exonuclease [Actinokineospora auranticolor]|uniref:Exonuclease n=1 Tax=Actinokineospora auranticolor TaxID=155976 RepID=A0A2S6GLS4_9PSEU|nr:3'-5' exonuclease [Actinokineospora auranticolor]PPK66189.1 exonuclease [Actinokineospora auranticolor]
MSKKTTDPVLRYENGVPVYRDGRAPEHLLTATALRGRRLSPAGLHPVGWVSTLPYHRVCALYDSTQARPIRPVTSRQRAVLAAGRELANTVPCRRCEQVRVSKWDEDRLCGTCLPVVETERHARMIAAAEDHERMLAADQAAAAWATEVLADPDTVVLDTETTGLHGDVRIVEIAVLDRHGAVLLDFLVHPGIPIPPDSTAIHGITDTVVAGAPRFAELLPALTEVLAGRRVIIYKRFTRQVECRIWGCRERERSSLPRPRGTSAFQTDRRRGSRPRPRPATTRQPGRADGMVRVGVASAKAFHSRLSGWSAA